MHPERKHRGIIWLVVFCLWLSACADGLTPEAIALVTQAAQAVVLEIATELEAYQPVFNTEPTPIDDGFTYVLSFGDTLAGVAQYCYGKRVFVKIRDEGNGESVNEIFYSSGEAMEMAARFGIGNQVFAGETVVSCQSSDPGGRGDGPTKYGVDEWLKGDRGRLKVVFIAPAPFGVWGRVTTND